MRYVLWRAAIVGVEDRRPVHDVAHPELAGGVEGEAAPVLARRLLRAARHQPLAAEQPMDGRRREQHSAGTSCCWRAVAISIATL